MLGQQNKGESMHVKKSFAIALVASVCAINLAPRALAAEFRTADVEDCVQQLYSDSEEARAGAGERLSSMGPEGKAAIPRLVEIVETDPVMSVRGEAAKALGSMGSTANSAVEPLLTFLKNKKGGIERAY